MKPLLRCLLVEDSEDDAQLMLHRLRSGGFNVDAVRTDSASTLCAALEQHAWDMVISDYRMPGFSGMDALAIVRARDRDLPFILVSGQMGEELAVNAMRAGANDYLTKDHLHRLAPAVQRELHEAMTRRAHRLAEAALRSSATRHEAILKSALDGYWLLDSNARIVEANSAYARMSGYSIDELLTMGVADLEATESATDIAEHLQKIQRLGNDRFDTRHRRKDGSEFDVEVSAQSIMGNESSLIVCFLRDVTERKMATAALRASEAQLRFVTDHAPVLIAHLDVERRYKFVNLAYAQAFGLQPSALLGRHTRELLGESIYAQAEPRITLALSGRHVEYDVESAYPSGALRTLHAVYAPEFDAGGQVVGFVAALVDISARKRMEEQLLISKQNLQATLDASPDLFFEMGLDGRYYAYHSPRLELLAAPPDQFLGKLVTEVLPADAAATILSALREAHEQQNSMGKQIRLLLPAGQTWFELSAARKATLAGEPPRFVVLSRDITARKQSELADAFLAQAGIDAGGEPFFQALARFLATSLQMDYVCIDRLEGDRLTATTLAVWHDGGFEDNLQYALADTPCGQVPGQKICLYPENVTSLFPRDAALQELRAESYVGVPLQSHDNVAIGLIAAIGRRPLTNRAQAEALLIRVAPRAAAELERLSAEAALRSSHAVLSKFNALAVGRELRMVELKREINELCAQLGEPPRHQVVSPMPANAHRG